MLWIPGCRSKRKVKIELAEHLKSWKYDFEFPGNLKVRGIFVINIR